MLFLTTANVSGLLDADYIVSCNLPKVAIVMAGRGEGKHSALVAFYHGSHFRVAVVGIGNSR